jgi:ComF family protein
MFSIKPIKSFKGPSSRFTAIKRQQWLPLVQRACQRLRLPQSCFLCQRLGAQAICGDCLLDLAWKTESCERCGVSLNDPHHRICHECRKQPPAFTHTYALFDYAYPVTNLLHGVKYGGQLAVLNLLAELMATHLNSKQLPELFVPVPMHAQDLRHRGYNQALELARVVACRVQRPVAATDVFCTRHKKMQARLSLAERQENVKGLFALRHPDRWRSLQHVAIVDDVVTTGSTVGELSRVLLAAGIQQVDVWCCARREGLQWE